MPYLSIEQIEQLISSGDKYKCGKGMFHLINAYTNQDHTQLLVKYCQKIPVDNLLLHMIKTYVMIRQNSNIVEFCDAHKDKAKEELKGMSDIYINRYLERVDWISSLFKCCVTVGY